MTRLFGTDGIRGTVGVWPLVPEFFLKLGYAVGTVLNHKTKKATLLIGRDTRQSGQMLQSAFMAGLLAKGVDVIDAGVVPTPVVAWLVRNMGMDAGAVVSASHNPVGQNGIKFFNGAGHKLAGAIEIEIERLVSSELDGPPVKSGAGGWLGSLRDGQALSELYIQGLLKEQPTRPFKNLTLLMDCANGATSQIAPIVFDRAGAHVIAIHASPTGSNINGRAGSEFARQHPDKVKALIHQHQADFYLAFDGDGDRVVFVDEKGTLIDGDHMLGMLAHYFDSQHKLLGRSVVTTTMRNEGLKNYLQRAGLQLFETPVGDKYVVEKLLELQGQFPHEGKVGLGGEQAGHIVLVDDEHTTGDGIRTALFVIRAFIESGETAMSQFATGIGKTPQVIASAYVGNGKRFNRDELDVLESELLADTVGLIRINLRYSGTEPLFRAMLESDDRLLEEELISIAIRVCRQAQEVSGIEDGMVEVLNCTRGGVNIITNK